MVASTPRVLPLDVSLPGGEGHSNTIKALLQIPLASPFGGSCAGGGTVSRQPIGRVSQHLPGPLRMHALLQMGHETPLWQSR